MFDGVLDPAKLKHNPEAISKLFKITGDTTFCTDDLYVVFPERYVNKKLAVMGATVKLLSIYAVIDKDYNYAVVIAPIYTFIQPTNVTAVVVKGVVNKVLEFDKGSIFCADNNLVRDDSFMYDLFIEFFDQGKVPWYISYEKLAELLAESSKYAGSGIGNDPLAFEIMSAIIARDSKDKLNFYRHKIKSLDDKAPVEYVGLNNVVYAYDNTLSKVMGGYMETGITTAVVNKEDRSNTVSKILRA